MKNWSFSTLDSWHFIGYTYFIKQNGGFDMTDLRDWREANFDRFETDEEMADYEAYCQDCDFLNGYSDEDELYDMEYPET